MINKLIVGRYLTLPRWDATIPAVDPTFPPNFLPAPGRFYNIEESTTHVPIFNPTRKSKIRQHQHAHKMHRTFLWLPWLTGNVSCVPLANTDVLTGIMTGCWLVIFQCNGVQYAGHIGTDLDPQHPNTIQAKAAWRNAVNTNQIVPVKAFNPVGPNLPHAATHVHGESVEFYGAFQSNGQVYTLVLARGHSDVLRRRIKLVVPMPTTPDVTAF